MVVIGGLGFIGNGIASKLSNSNHNVYILDIKSKVKKLLPENSPYSYCYLENGKLFYWNMAKKEASLLQVKFDVVISALRDRTTKDKNIENYVSEDLSSLVNYVSSMTSALLDSLHAILEMNKEIAPHDCTILIGLYSTNSNLISHQPLSYHLVNSLFEQCYRFLSVRTSHPALYVFPVQIGVVLPSNRGKGEFEDIGVQRTVSLEDLCELILFLVEKQPLSLSGCSLTFTSGRSNMDVTSAFEGIFGNLDVRGKRNN